jgi:hypothetical protein
MHPRGKNEDQHANAIAKIIKSYEISDLVTEKVEAVVSI